MSEFLYQFREEERHSVVALPFPLEKVVEDWSRLRSRMVRDIPAEFARAEWAYLVNFLNEDSLLGTFKDTFGEMVPLGSAMPAVLVQPRGQVAVWLPNNVSLLGPLALILLSLTGNRIRLKGGKDSEDLTGSFLRFTMENLRPGELLAALSERVQHEVFGRDDPRSHEMARDAQIRVVFGSDAAAEAVHDMPHPVGSRGFSFIDRRSEVWIETSCATDELLVDLLKVFAIYGQAGCTSPRRIILLDASSGEVARFGERLLQVWEGLKFEAPAMHIASGNLMGKQLADAVGWNTRLAAGHGAAFATGDLSLPECSMPMGLAVVGASVQEARNALPENIQTIGYAFQDPTTPAWMRVFAGTGVKRIVPLATMHHFGPVWDGEEFWRGCFEFVSLG
jgi:hypothetical protein